MEWATLDTPVGPVAVGVAGDAVRQIRFAPEDPACGDPSPQASVADPSGLLADAVVQLRAYFAGEATRFALPMSFPDHSAFERAVWTELTRIPYAETRTYGQVAAALGDRSAARAVGTACNRNPLPLLVPCHRVIGAGGKLVGFGAGLPRKRWLLEWEARMALVRAWS